jgi:hypothetical protein
LLIQQQRRQWRIHPSRCAMVQNLDVTDASTSDMLLESSAHNLNLGQFGHGRT